MTDSSIANAAYYWNLRENNESMDLIITIPAGITEDQIKLEWSAEHDRISVTLAGNETPIFDGSLNKCFKGTPTRRVEGNTIIITYMKAEASNEPIMVVSPYGFGRIIDPQSAYTNFLRYMGDAVKNCNDYDSQSKAFDALLLSQQQRYQEAISISHQMLVKADELTNTAALPPQNKAENESTQSSPNIEENRHNIRNSEHNNGGTNVLPNNEEVNAISNNESAKSLQYNEEIDILPSSKETKEVITTGIIAAIVGGASVGAILTWGLMKFTRIKH